MARSTTKKPSRRTRAAGDLPDDIEVHELRFKKRGPLIRVVCDEVSIGESRQIFRDCLLEGKQPTDDNAVDNEKLTDMYLWKSVVRLDSGATVAKSLEDVWGWPTATWQALQPICMAVNGLGGGEDPEGN